MSSKSKCLLRGAIIGALALSMQLVVGGSAQAASKCTGAGYLCFYDYGTSQYGNLAGNNPNWSVFGWDARADWFHNYGTKQNVCVWEKHNSKGKVYTILRGKTWTWPNWGRSDSWTSKTYC
jgi:hypothetical protein